MKFIINTEDLARIMAIYKLYEKEEFHQNRCEIHGNNRLQVSMLSKHSACQTTLIIEVAKSDNVTCFNLPYFSLPKYAKNSKALITVTTEDIRVEIDGTVMCLKTPDDKPCADPSKYFPGVNSIAQIFVDPNRLITALQPFKKEQSVLMSLYGEKLPIVLNSRTARTLVLPIVKTQSKGDLFYGMDR